MRKLILTGLIAASLAPAAAMAQTRELHDDRRALHEEQHELQRAIHDGAPDHVVRQEMRDVQETQRETREDWRDYRRRNPTVYRGPAYVGPRGYVYRPVNAGYRFQPGYYDRRYWVDANRYHLAPVARNERWVRYGRDVVRVDLRTGRVVSVYNGFFY